MKVKKTVGFNRLRIEQWDIACPKSKAFPDGRQIVTKVAIRNNLGQFHGATNFRGSVLGK